MRTAVSRFTSLPITFSKGAGTLAKAALVGAVVATAALALAACAPQTAAPSASESGEAGPAELSVGIITSETGPLAGYGKQYLDGFKAGLDWATDGTGEVNGTKLNIDYRDDAGVPDTAVAIAKELIGAGTNILAGSASSGVAAVSWLVRTPATSRSPQPTETWVGDSPLTGHAALGKTVRQSMSCKSWQKCP